MSSNPSIDFLEMLKAGSSKTQVTGSTKRTSAARNSGSAGTTSSSSRASTAESLKSVRTAASTNRESIPSVTRTNSKRVTVEKNTPEEKDNIQKMNRESVTGSRFAVIDTETNWRDQVMSIGVAIADAATFKCVDCMYYIIDPEYRSGGMYSGVLRYHVKRNTCSAGLGHKESGEVSSEELLASAKEHITSRKEALLAIKNHLQELGISSIYAYNGKFDLGHLPELGCFEWYDIMRLAAYKQYNRAIDDSYACCKTGRLKSNYGVEPITRMLSGDMGYCEVHNAVYDAVDELRIIELLGRGLEEYEVAKIN